MKKYSNSRKILNLAWVPYILILFEMLYMATPFAAFFYSVYELPLKYLNENPLTARLIQSILPHFIETNSSFLHLLVKVGWGMMAIGSIVFIAGFIQIYYNKFAKKSAVTNGIYKIIRHPQYAAWIIFGLGMALVWSRLIVWLMLINMIFIYFFLARAEEKECLEKYSDTYPLYFQRTGMFFPKIFKFQKFNFTFPKSKFFSALIFLVIYFSIISITIVSANALRNFTISKMSTVYGKDYMAVSVTYINTDIAQKSIDIMLKNKKVKDEIEKIFVSGDTKIFYLMPQSWTIPELGMTTEIQSNRRANVNVSAHGNQPDTMPLKKRVLVSQARLIKDTEPASILNYMKQQIPKLYIDIDLELDTVIGIYKPPTEGIYSNIPVPVF